MTDQRLDQFASVIAAELRETELRIDMSLAQAGVLLTSMTAGRNEAGLPASFGQTALTKLGAAIATGVEYRSSLISLHRSLEAAGNKIGKAGEPADETAMGHDRSAARPVCGACPRAA